MIGGRVVRCLAQCLLALQPLANIAAAGAAQAVASVTQPVLYILYIYINAQVCVVHLRRGAPQLPNS